jgi:mannosyltransferase
VVLHMTSTDRPRLGPEGTVPLPADRSRKLRRSTPVSPRVLAGVVALAVLLGLLARVRTASVLWLDEALSVEIASRPLQDLPELLRRDGAPPLYYLLLHCWVALFGDSEVAARSLSAVLGALTLPLAWLLGRRVGGRPAAVALLLLLATSPFAVRYSTEARMYTLVMLLVVAGTLALLRVLERPAPGRVAVLAALTGAGLLTHYWLIYLVAVVGAGLLWRQRRPGPGRPGQRAAAAGVALGGLAFLPWLPVFSYQVAHTGTPWGRPPDLAAVLDAPTQWAGGATDSGRVLALLLVALAAMGYGGRAARRASVTWDLHGRDVGRALLGVVAATLIVAVVAGQLTGSSYAARYTSVVLPLFLLLAAVGVAALPAGRPRIVALGLATAAGLWGSLPLLVHDQRTQAAAVAAALRDAVAPGDVVVYCPDQLGPDTTRLLPAGLDQRVYPTGAAPDLVDWRDYAERNEAADPDRFLADLTPTLPPGADVWVVWYGGYDTYAQQCERLVEIGGRRWPATTVVHARRRYHVPMNLTRLER